MNYTKKEAEFKSSNGINDIKYYTYTPKQEIKAIVQLSHGMCEYVERYEHFAAFLCENGVLVCGNDHLGHGRSVSDKSGLGYFSKKDGYKHLSEDVHKLTKIIKKEYPKTPYFLFGHSMGSFIAREYLMKYSKGLAGAIICGTSGGVPFPDANIFIVKLLGKIKGEKYRSKLLAKIAFLSYNSRFKDGNTGFEWLTNNKEIVNKYINDSLCNFIFTTSAFADLGKLLKLVSSNEWYNSLDKNLNMFLISGEQDPVGQYGKGVMKVYNKLVANGMKNVKVKLYKNGRHEILNDIENKVVFEDVLNFILSYSSSSF